jgi:hypothetical protein
MFDKFAKYVECVHEAELTLQGLMKIEKVCQSCACECVYERFDVTRHYGAQFAAQVASIHSQHTWQDGGATLLPDLLLAPLRQLAVYDALTRALYDATPPEDFKERRRLQYVCGLFVCQAVVVVVVRLTLSQTYSGAHWRAIGQADGVDGARGAGNRHATSGATTRGLSVGQAGHARTTYPAQRAARRLAAHAAQMEADARCADERLAPADQSSSGRSTAQLSLWYGVCRVSLSLSLSLSC